MYHMAGIIKNDFSAAPGVCLTAFVQGCDIHCPGCHNPELQDFEGGHEYNFEIQDQIIQGLTANGIHRSFCIMGGEPLAKRNLEFTQYLITMVHTAVPGTKIYVWTGHTYEELLKSKDTTIHSILQSADFLIDGPYIAAQRDITLTMRGSRNQRIINLKTGEIMP